MVSAQGGSMDALSFELAGSRYALLAHYVREVLRAVAIEPLPHAPFVIAGVFNLRGVVVPVVDMRKRLGLVSKEIAPEDYFIVADTPGFAVALHIDRALDLIGVTPTPLARITPGLAQTSYIAGVVPTADGVLLIQDLPAFLSSEEAAALGQALHAAGGEA